jgi:hypothetical protein
MSAQEVQVKVPAFYINIMLLNKEQIVEKKVSEKAGTGFVGKLLASSAARLVSDETVMTNLGTVLMTKVVEAVDRMGIRAEMKKVYQQGPFIAIRVEIVSIDRMQLIRVAKGDEFANKFQNLLDALSDLGMAEQTLPKVDDNIAKKIHSGMMSKFQEVIPTKMAENNVQVECQVVTREEQADTFFTIIENL